jgi:hypothetical protein
VFDGVDNNEDGIIDDQDEVYSESLGAAKWGYNIDNQNIILNEGRKKKGNILYDPYEWVNFDPDGDGVDESEGDCYACSYIGLDDHIRGIVRYNEDLFKLEFDVFIYDYGDDQLPGDPFIDESGNDTYDVGEAPNFLGTDFFDCGLDGLCPGDEGYDLVGQPIKPAVKEISSKKVWSFTYIISVISRFIYKRISRELVISIIIYKYIKF